ncbi:MAG: divalent-cation tolerance protein CutA [Candidatus Marinamargulisbacteria bacterium]
MNHSLLIMQTTFPISFDCQPLVHSILQKKWAVCVQKEHPITSQYHWKGQIETDTEQRLTIKFLASHQPKLTQFISENHPYDIPEIIIIAPQYISPAYWNWANSLNPENY